MRNQDEDFTEFEREETAPLDMLAALFEARGWDFEPVSDEEVSAEFKGSWTSYQIRAIWREEDKREREALADAIVTAPLSKEALHLAGHHFEGHTELLAHLTGQRDAVMMLAHDAMRVSHVTTHCALSDVPRSMVSSNRKSSRGAWRICRRRTRCCR